MTTEYTPNFRFNLPDFRMGPWHDLTNINTTRIDELLMAIYQGVDTSPWMNNTTYTAGETAVDPADNSFWVCIVPHTSAPVPTTFAADRAAHPGYWNRVVVGISPRGQWTNSTHYLVNDMVTDSVQGVLAVCVTEHTSNVSGTIRDDHVYWTFIADMTGNPIMEASFIDYDDSTGYTGSTNVDGALDYLAGVTHTNSTTIATHTTQINNNTTNIATNATNIAAEKTRNDTQDGLISANAAAISGKISEAPNDAKQYARQSLGWHEVTGFPEAPTDGKKYARQNAAWAEVGDAAVLISDTPPASPKDNTLWWESDTGLLYIRYNDGDSAQWVVALPQIDAASFVAKAGDTMTGDLHINKANPRLYLEKGASGEGADIWSYSSGKLRWITGTANTLAETGSNAGSDWALYRFDDAGTYLGEALRVSRANGASLFSGVLTIQGADYAAQLVLYNSQRNKRMTLRMGGGTATPAFEIVNDANTAVIAALADNGNFQCNGVFTVGAGGTTGSINFGNSGTKYLQYNGTNYVFNGGNVQAGGNFYTNAGSPNTGTYFFGYDGSKYLVFDGSNYILTGGTLFCSGDVIANGGSFRVRALNSSANSHVWFDDEAGNNKCIFYWERSGNRQLIVINGQQYSFGYNGVLTVPTGYNCKAGGAGAFGSNFFNLYYNAGPCQLWIDNTNLGNISVTCDYRTKKDVEDLPSTWEHVKNMRPVCYTQADAFNGLFVANDEKQWGFIAHELQADLIPSAATGTKDEENVVQSPNLLTIVAALTKSLQEAMERIEALEAKLV